jgi:D-beta-D-heptose 7-phosphate kinase/D-beta-D-heptose 1-phosphate adenosyltransferase
MWISRRQSFNPVNWFIHKPRVVFTNGCFDVLHVGHLHLLKEAALLGDRLIVGINSDASVRSIKGQARPIQSEQVRRAQLEILPWVHEVHVFDELTPARLIEQIKPDLIVKGGDYVPDQVVGAHVAPVHIVCQLPGHSTSALVSKMRNQL